MTEGSHECVYVCMYNIDPELFVRMSTYFNTVFSDIQTVLHARQRWAGCVGQPVGVTDGPALDEQNMKLPIGELNFCFGLHGGVPPYSGHTTNSSQTHRGICVVINF